ncbi:1-acyl-sn-glycerol-3-phosphate acyltransferase [uncultured Croceitalea sp.]|uniref:1-acyl-sn-glycerol-3-phosphate acyltransferase n=1 Tax=uncultured Croceitalea sp. TaxID=1798908 RepID=UPI0033060523
MKQLGYHFFKCWISLGLFFYFKKIRIVGIETIPFNKPTLFLSNHQNALLDALLIATRSKLKPWYLTRSDVFKSKLFSPLFYFLQMLPIYRLRDGKDTLSKNRVIFNRCGELLNDNEMLLVFPEANHNLKRRVRPISKGFTRLMFNALAQNSDLDLKLIPIGQNYINADGFPDSASLYFGKPIAVQDLLTENSNETILRLKSVVSEELKKLTTHIEDEKNYDQILQELIIRDVDFLNPMAVNNLIGQLDKKVPKNSKNRYGFLNNLIMGLFALINLPVVFVWRAFIKPKVPELEFMSTFRFAFSMIVYPICYMVFILVLSYAYNIKAACLIVLGHAALNVLFIKLGLTSSGQRK